jgi:hypothetical protein
MISKVRCKEIMDPGLGHTADRQQASLDEFPPKRDKIFDDRVAQRRLGICPGCIGRRSPRGLKLQVVSGVTRKSHETTGELYRFRDFLKAVSFTRVDELRPTIPHHISQIKTGSSSGPDKKGPRLCLRYRIHKIRVRRGVVLTGEIRIGRLKR